MSVAPKPNLSIPTHILQCQPYVPGKPIEELERELGVQNIIKLASNENPLGPSPKVLAALRDLAEPIRLYPDANHYYLREQLAEYNTISSSEIIVGNGSNEILELFVRSLCLPGENIVSCGAAFIAYKISALIHGVEYRESPLQEDLSPDLDAMLRLCDNETKIIFLPNPNNPTGTYANQNALLRFIEKLRGRSILLVLDSAYLEYVTATDFPDPLELYRKYPNIALTRTFSKAFGMAGLRVGYGIAHPDILQAMHRVKMPFNVANPGLIAAQAALGDIIHIKRSFEMNSEGMQYLEREFSRLGIRHWPSQGNFLLIDVGKSVLELNQNLLREGVIVRPVAGFGLKTHLRVTIGNKAQNQMFISALEKHWHGAKN